MIFFHMLFSPIKPPEAGLFRVLYDAGQWLCDNLSVVMVVFSAGFLILRPFYYAT